MLHPNYPIVTDRLVLRPFDSADLDALHAFHRREDVARYLFWEPRDREQVAAALERKRGEYRIVDEGQSLSLAVVEASGRSLVGEVHLAWRSREHRQGEFGFVFDPEHQGRGYATEAAGVVLRLGFADLGLHRIVGHCDARNTASARLMERLGMRREAHFVHNRIFKGRWDEELVYALLDDEWAAAAVHDFP